MEGYSGHMKWLRLLPQQFHLELFLDFTLRIYFWILTRDLRRFERELEAEIPNCTTAIPVCTNLSGLGRLST